MATNPYAHHLAGPEGQGNLDPRAILAATPGVLHQLCCELTPEQIEAPWAPGKWSPREIVAHLADCELVFSFRFRQTLAATPHAPATVQPFDQEAWAARYAAYALPEALELFRAARAWNLKLIGSLSAADFEREAMHPERGSMSFRFQTELVAGHDLNHLQQLHTVVSRA